MDETVQWVLKLVDEATGPAKQAASALEKVEKQLKKVDAAGGKAKGSGGFGGFITELNQGLGVAQKAGQAFAVIAGAVTSLAATGVKLTAFKESTLTAFKTLAGAGIGDDLYKQVLAASRAFAIAPDAALDSVKALLGAGFDAKQAMQVFASATDLSKLTGGDSKALTQVLGQILSKGKLQTEELLQLAESGGLAMSKVFAEIGALKGIDANTAEGKEKITKLLEGGKIDAQTGIKATMNAIKGMTGKEAGEFSKEAATGIGSLLEKLKTGPEALFLSLDTSGATESLRKFLTVLNGLFDPDTAGGAKVVEVMQAVAKVASELMDSISGMDAEGGLIKVADALIAILPAISGFSTGALEGLAAALGPMFDGMNSAGSSAETWKSLGKAIGITVGALVWIGVVLADTFGWFYKVGAAIVDLVSGVGSLGSVFEAMFGGGLIASLIESFGDGAKGLAGAFIDGLVQGIADGATSVLDAVTGLGGSMVGAAEDALGIASPSKVGQEIGRNFGDSTGMGMEAALPTVEGSAAKMTGGMVAGASAAPSGSTGGEQRRVV